MGNEKSRFEEKVRGERRLIEYVRDMSRSLSGNPNDCPTRSQLCNSISRLYHGLNKVLNEFPSSPAIHEERVQISSFAGCIVEIEQKIRKLGREQLTPASETHIVQMLQHFSDQLDRMLEPYTPLISSRTHTLAQRLLVQIWREHKLAVLVGGGAALLGGSAVVLAIVYRPNVQGALEYASRVHLSPAHYARIAVTIAPLLASALLTSGNTGIDAPAPRNLEQSNSR